MEKMLITGATGFLGSRAADFYQGRYEVHAPTHRELDITDPQATAYAVSRYQPSIVIHCAAISDVGQCEKEPEKSWAINVTGSINIAKASREVHASCILCSSDQVYFGASYAQPEEYRGRQEMAEGMQGSRQEVAGGMQGSRQEGDSHNFSRGRHEEEELCPSNVYGRQKLKAEQECLKANPDCVLLRLSWMYDAKTRKQGEHGELFRTLLPQIQGTGKIAFPIHDRRGITDVTEVVQNLEKTFLLQGGVYNFGSPNEKDTYRVFQEVFSNVGIDTNRLEENREAFCANPRNLTMCQKKINQCGIFFTHTIESLSKNLADALENGRF